MSSGDSSSQNPSFQRRKPADQSESSASHPQLGFLSSLTQSGQAPDFQPDALPIPIPPSTWSFSSSVPTLTSGFQLAHTFPIPLHQQSSATSLSSSISLHSSFFDPDAPRYGQSAQPSYDSIEHEEQSPAGQAHGLGIPSYPMSVASDTYFAGSMMQPNSHPYGWADRPFQPLQSPPGNMNQQYPPSQPYPASGYQYGYPGQPGGQMQTYPQDPPTPSYLPGAPGSARQNQSSSPSMARTFPPPPPPPPPAGTVHDQSMMSPPAPYMMSPTGYFLPEALPVPSSHTPSMSSQSSSMVTEPVFSPTESVPSSDTDQVRVISSRPRPQCWDHGCNGREFSTFSNLLRHQREKSGVVAKAECPVCGAVFTRTTARNIHVAQGKCKGPGRESSAE